MNYTHTHMYMFVGFLFFSFSLFHSIITFDILFERQETEKKKEERSDVKLIIVTGTGRQGQKENVRLPILPDIVIKESIVRRTNLDRVTKILYPEVY